jgi:ABC-type metal ion transport system substrate-binding protein
MAYKIILTPGTKHWGKLVEKETEKFVQWLSNPYEKDWQTKCKELLKKIYENYGNTLQIASFIDYFNKNGALSEKQYNYLQEKYGV